MIMESSKTLTMNMVTISGVEKGVEVKKGGTLTIKDGTITFKDGKDNYGVKVGSGVTDASLTNVTIEGTGSGKGVIKEGTGEMMMTKVDVLNVEKGVYATGGI
ncbi:hypothetical protein BBbe_10330 [Bartonella bovis 91-4]|uniref:Autotransporter n=1 Tax=Bartonella bovis 91-4 TaxID=1094491 RepID=N6VBX3_9HYPH|nr:hypothetical protein BBbe_10330 [Bartonella bovis 91-4]